MGLSHDERVNVCISLARCLPTASAALSDGLDDMLDRAQDWFGPRDQACIVTSIWFGGDHPKVSYPQRPAKYAQVRLSEGALREASRGDLHYAFWQLAHETIHLLSPTPGHRVNVLEEGMACCFQDEYMRGYTDYAVPKQHLPSFVEAEALVRGLLDLDDYVIKKARQVQPIISCISADTLSAACPAFPEEGARALTERFLRDRHPPSEQPS